MHIHIYIHTSEPTPTPFPSFRLASGPREDIPKVPGYRIPEAWIRAPHDNHIYLRYIKDKYLGR